MRYRSNLMQTEITGFHLLDPPKQMMGHDVPSDPDFEPNCGFLTHDEAAILMAVSREMDGSRWADIGSRLGWTAQHIILGGADDVYGVDPEYHRQDFWRRATEQTPHMIPSPHTSEEFFRMVISSRLHIDAVMIDGNHDSPEPTLDAQRAIAAGARVLVWHDFWGQPIQDAVTHVVRKGWKSRIYSTPNGMALAWNDASFVPPDHVPDPAIDWELIRKQRAPEFHFGACA